MAHRLERLTEAIRSRPGRTAAAALVILALLLAWSLTAREPASPGPASVEQTLVVRRSPLVIMKGFRGAIAVGDSVAIIAPFDGVVTRLNFAYGDHVGAGQVLAELDPSEIQRTRNEAESVYLKASQAAADMRNWQSGPEMSRARRGLTAATLDLSQTERRLQETRTLLDRGLVPRLEYETLEQQVLTQRMMVEAAEEDLRVTARRGEGASRRVAALEVANAAGRLGKLNADVEGATIVAPDAGIMVLPPTGGQNTGDPGVRVGMPLTRGQPLGTIARAGGLSVRFTLDEGDVNLIKPGQMVMVTGPGFQAVLNGRVHSIAGQASADGTPGKATFVATAQLDPLAADQAQQVRIGMSADIRVLSYRNMTAIVVPPQAVQGAGGSATVMVRDRGRKTSRRVAVKVGQVAPQGVEILSGLKPGEVVVWGQ